MLYGFGKNFVLFRKFDFDIIDLCGLCVHGNQSIGCAKMAVLISDTFHLFRTCFLLDRHDHRCCVTDAMCLHYSIEYKISFYKYRKKTF